MGDITLYNDTSDMQDDDFWSKPVAKFYLTRWNTVIADPVLNWGDSTTVSISGTSLTALAQNDSQATAEMGITVETQNIAVAEGSNNTIQFLIGPTAGATTPDMITLVNMCSFPVVFSLNWGDAPSTVITVAPNESYPLLIGNQYTCYARVHGYATEPSDGYYDTDKVTFSAGNATLTLTGKDKFTITVS